MTSYLITMRHSQIRQIFLFGVALFSVVLFFIFMLSQLNTLPFVFLQSSQRDGLQRFKNQFFSFPDNNDESCKSTNHNPRKNISIYEGTTRIEARNIDNIIKESGLDLKDKWTSPSYVLFTEVAIMEAALPPFKPRIPAVVFHNNVFMLFCEARFEGLKDYGHMMIAMRRGVFHSKDQEIQWDTIKIIAHLTGFRTMNPSPVVDRIHNTIMVVFAGFPSTMSFQEMMNFPGFPLSKLYVIKSYDLGLSWTDPQDISEDTILKIHPIPVLLVPGPGHSIQMECGRIIVPVNYFTEDSHGVRIPHMCSNCTNYVRVLYSDDGGLTWSVGKRSPFSKDPSGIIIHPNEIQAAEIDDNTLCLNARTLAHNHPRSIIFSTDGGRSLQPNNLSPRLVEPGYKKDGTPMWAAGCAGSVISFKGPNRNTGTGISPHRRWVLFSNPADADFRRHLSIHLSIDGCKSWSHKWVVFEQAAAYSDMTYFEHNNEGKTERYVAIFHEGGFRRELESMKFKIFNLEAVLSGIQEETQR